MYVAMQEARNGVDCTGAYVEEVFVTMMKIEGF